MLAMFNPLHSSMNQENHLCNQCSHYGKYGRFLLQKKPSRATAKLLSAKMNGTQRRILGKSMKNALYMPKGTSLADVTSNSEKIKPPALAIVEIRLSEGIIQTVTQSVTQCRKFH